MAPPSKIQVRTEKTSISTAVADISGKPKNMDSYKAHTESHVSPTYGPAIHNIECSSHNCKDSQCHGALAKCMELDAISAVFRRHPRAGFNIWRGFVAGSTYESTHSHGSPLPSKGPTTKKPTQFCLLRPAKMPNGCYRPPLRISTPSQTPQHPNPGSLAALYEPSGHLPGVYCISQRRKGTVGSQEALGRGAWGSWSKVAFIEVPSRSEADPLHRLFWPGHVAEGAQLVLRAALVDAGAPGVLAYPAAQLHRPPGTRVLHPPHEFHEGFEKKATKNMAQVG